MAFKNLITMNKLDMCFSTKNNTNMDKIHRNSLAAALCAAFLFLMSFSSFGQTVTTIAVDEGDLTSTSAVLKGHFENNEGIAVTSYGFKYSDNAMSLSNDLPADYTGDPFSATLTGLTPGTTYYYRAYVYTDAQGQINGSVESFTTPTGSSPTAGGSVNWITIGGGPGNNTNLPVNIYYKYSLSQQIYTPAEIGRAGTIERIAFYNNTDNIARTIDLYMFTSDRQSFTSTTDWETVSSSDRVFSGEVTFLSGEWTEIALTTPFEYDGVSNIIVVTDDNTAYDATTQRFLTFEASGQSIYVNGDDTDFDPTDLSSTTAIGLEDVKNQIKLGFTSTNPTFEYVDLGLPSGTKWATMNIGAERPEDFGTYFAWGETSPKTVYDWESYIYADGDSDSDPQLTKYCNDSGLGITDALTELETGDDAATAILGSNWRMPTYDEVIELRDYCEHVFTTQNGVAGTLVTGPNNQSIFIPAAAGRYYNNLILSEGTGSYWSSSLDTDDPTKAQGLSLGSDGFGTITSPRYFGLPIRPVYATSQTANNNSEDVIYECDFEDDTEIANWTIQGVNSGQTNYWTIGMTEQGEANLNSLFVTNDGGSYSYTNTSTSAVYAYHSLSFTERLNYNIAFDWQCNGESTYDYLRAFLVPTSADPDFSAGNEIANGYTETPDGWIDINNGRMNQAGREWMHADKTMIIEPGDYYLVFYWRNDDGAGDNPPAAVDNIVITKLSCPPVSDITASEITPESATLTWTEIGSAGSWEVIVSETELTDTELETNNNVTTVSSPSYSATGLEQAHTYYIYVRAACSSDEKSRWTSGEFSSAFCAAEDMCEIRYELEDSYGDGWNDNTLNVVDASTGDVLASWTIQDGSSASGTLAVCDGRDIRFEYVGDNYPDETSYKVYDVNGDLIFEGSDKFTDPIHYMMSCSSCLSVNNLMATGVNDESATISWGDRNSTGTWEFIVSDQNLSGPELDGATVQTLTDSTYSLSGLTPTTIYYVYVRSVCSAEEKSGWKSLTFRTTQVPAQIPYSYGFEDESENAIWTLNVGASNGWSVGEAAYNDGSKGLYVSNDNGASNSYDTGSETSIYAYRTLNVPELCYYSVSFDWMAKGEADYDYLRVFMVPTSLNADLSSGVQNEINVSSTPANWIELYSNGGKMNDSDSWQTNTIEVALEQGLYNLVFYWRNDNGGGEIPPAAIDNISVTKLVPFRLSAQVQPGWGSTAATLEGNINFLGEVQTLTAGFEVGVNDTNLADSVAVTSSDGTFTHEFTGLDAQTIYYYRAFVIYNDEPVYSDIAQFKTRNNDNGTESSPLIIESETDWGDFVAAIQNGAGSGADAAGDYKGSEIVDGALGMYFKIGNDFTLTSSNITVNGFKGILLGDGKTITLDNSAGYGTDFKGLFSTIYNATIDSLNVLVAQSITIPSPETSDNNGFGLLCSEVYSSSVISDCTISGGEGILLNCNEARFGVGALVGSVNNATITNCTNNLDVDGYYVAGIAGLMKGGTISKCTNNAAIKSETEGYYVGGIVYSIEGNVQSTITECLNTGALTSGGIAGGIVARINGSNSTISKCMNIGQITTNYTDWSTGEYAGGIVGGSRMSSTITNNANYGSFGRLSSNIGGIAGNNMTSLSKNVSAPVYLSENIAGNSSYNIFATMSVSVDNYETANEEDDDFFDEQIGDIKVDSLRLRFASHATAMPTSDMVGSALSSSLSSENWIFTNGLYPMPAGIPESPKTTVARIPMYLAENETVFGVMSNFTVPTTISGQTVEWTSSSPDVIAISDGSATVTRPASGEADVDVTLTATCQGETKTFILRVIGPKQIPVVTNEANVGETVTLHGEFSSDTEGITYVKEYGFKYGKESDLSDAVNLVSTNLGIDLHESTRFTAVINDFDDSKYYYAAYATTADATTLGEIKSFKKSTAPEVIAKYPMWRTNSEATIEFDITLNEGEEFYGVESAFYYGTESNNLNLTGIINYDDDYGYYSTDLSNLTADTKYYYVAEVANDLGTTRSDTLEFLTCGTMTDSRDGTQYYTIRIGNQTWMAQNLKYAGNIPQGSETSSTDAYRYNPDDFSDAVDEYGYLYNWAATMNGENPTNENPSSVQGICPSGWHLPSDAEWTQLTDYLGGTGNAGVMLAGQPAAQDRYWQTSDMTMSVTFGKSGFNALPAGYYVGTNYSSFGSGTGFWSATENTSEYAYVRSIYYESTSMDRNYDNKVKGNSVRCVKGSVVYAYDTLPYCGESYTYHDTVITASGDYTVRIQNGETENIYKLHLTLYPALVPTISSYSNGCYGENNGYVEVGVSGGAGTYTYNWSTPDMQTDARLSNLADGEYTVTVTDAAGCTATISQTLITPGELTASVSGNNPNCYGDQTTLTANANGGTTDYSYAWSSGESTSSITVSPTATTTYTVTVTDANNCTVVASKNIVVNTELTVSISGDTEVQCFGDITASLTATANGGSMAMGYTYAWSNSQSGQIISTLGAGNYSVTVTDGNSCTASASTTITGPSAALSIDISATNNTLTCSNLSATITATVTGGTEGYTYNWSNSGTNNTSEVTTPGSYTVVVTDANGCSVEAAQTITEDKTAPTVTIDNNETELNCNRTSITLTATGSDASYVWSNGGTNAANTVTAPATYTVTATGSNGCTSDASTTITQVDNPTVSVTSSEIQCYGESTTFTANANGGAAPYTYSWQDDLGSGQTLEAQAGTYAVTVTDNNGCTASANGTASQPTQLTASISSPTNVSCNGASDGSATVTANGGTTDYTYLWSNNATTPTVNDLAAGTYNVTVTDANSCTAVTNTTITQPEALTVTIYGEHEIFSSANVCAGAELQLIASIEDSQSTYETPYYAWERGMNEDPSDTNSTIIWTRMNFEDGEWKPAVYEDRLAYSNNDDIGYPVGNPVDDGYENYNDITIVEVPSPTAPAYTHYYYRIIVAGSVDDLNGNICISTSNTFEINVTRIAEIEFGGTNAICEGGVINLAVTETSPAGTWSIYAENGNTGGPFNASITNSGTNYSVVNAVHDEIVVQYTTSPENGGCWNKKTIPIYSLPEVTITPENTTICEGTDVTLHPSSNQQSSFQWSGGPSCSNTDWASDNTCADWTVNPITTTTYTLTVTTSHDLGMAGVLQCESTESKTVTVSPAIELSVTANNITCNGANNGNAIVNVTNGTAPYTYEWSNGQTNAQTTNLSTGTYTVTVRDNNGCSVVESLEITQPDALTTSLSATSILCNGQTSNITNTVAGGTPNYTYNWNNGATTQNLEGVGGGTYSVTVTDANSCVATASVTVNEPEELTSELSAGTIACNGSTTDITNAVSGGTTPITYNWSNGANTQNLTGVVAGTYSVTVRDNNSCSVVREITITQPNVLTVSVNAGSVACNGSMTTASAVVSGGTEPYEYQWSNSATTQTITDIIAGTYSVTVTDDNGCSTNAFTTITQPDALAVTISGSTSVCEGTTTTLTANVQGGTADFTYSWSNGETTNAITTPQLTVATEYSVTVTDANNCTVSTNVNVEIGDTPGIEISQVSAICVGNEVMLQANVSNAGSDYTVQWSSLDTGAGLPDITSTETITVTPTAAGIYTYTARLTATSCSDGQPFNSSANVQLTVNELPDAAITNNTNETTITCSTTEISLTATGGTNYVWSNGVETADNNITAAGNYTVTVTDANGCSNTESIVITEDVVAPTVSIINSTGTTLLTCTTTAINVEAQGTGTSYLWSNDTITATNTFTEAGTYFVTATAENGCSSSASLAITQPETLTATASAEPLGNDNTTSASVTVNGGTAPYNYLWSNGETSQTINNISVGTYSVTVTDANDCSVTSSVAISLSEVTAYYPARTTTSAELKAKIVGSEDLESYKFYFGTARNNLAEVNESMTSFNNEDSTIIASVSDLTAETRYYYVAEVTNSYGTSYSDTISFYTYGQITDDRDDNQYYTIQIGEQKWMAENLRATRFANGIEISLGTSISSTEPYRYYPNGDEANAAGYGYLYNWTAVMNGENSSNANPSGVQGICPNGWHVPSNAEWTQLTNYVGSEYACGGDSNQITKALSANTGWITYSNPCAPGDNQNLNNASGFNALTAGHFSGSYGAFGEGPYFWTATENDESRAQCLTWNYSTREVQVSGGNDKYSSFSIRCVKGSMTYVYDTVNFCGEEYAYHDTTYTESGDYVRQINISEDVDSTFYLHLTMFDELVATISDYNNGCYGQDNGFATVSAEGGSEPYNYAWNNGATTQTANGLGSGTYNITITDANGCIAISSVEITQPDAITSSFAETACDSYEWNGTTYTETDDYTQTFLAANGCDSIVTLHLTINNATTGIDTQVACDSYTWIDGVTYTESTDVPTFTLSNAEGCDSVVTLHLTINHSNTGIDEQTACDSYEWIDGVTYTESTDAPTFTLTNAEGCDSIVTLHLTINNSNTGEFADQMCSGVPYVYEGETFTEAGTYTVTLVNSHGCDSIVTLTLTYSNTCGGIVSGIVTDENTGDAIPNAKVTIGNRVTRTNAEGQYSLEVIRGLKALRVSATGYISYSRTVDIQSDTTFNASLNSPQIHTDTDSIIVSSYPYLEQSDSITLSNNGNGTLVWSSITEYDNLELIEDSTIQRRNTRSLWDSIQTFATRENAEQAIATDGFFIYTASWMRPGEFNRYTPNGEYVETFYVENVGSIRNLSYDGTYFYGTEATNIIFKIDLDNQMLVDSIETDIPEIRHCSFNRQDGSLLAGSWNSLYRIDTASGTSQQIRDDLANVYSSAFDNLSAGGPYLWLFSQTSQNNGPSACIRQFNISTGEYTSKTHYLDDINLTNSSLAGGICASEYVCEGRFVLLADVQNPAGSNTIATYEIGRTSNVVKTGKKSGMIEPNGSESISVKANATATGDYTATIKYRAAVMGRQSNDINVSISAVAPECEAVQQISIVTDTFHTVTLDWQPVELGDYENISYFVYNAASQYPIDTLSGTTVTYDGLPVGEHCFYVRALSSSNYTCLSEASDTVCAEIQNIPCNVSLIVEARNDGEAITISWNMPVGVDYFNIYRYSEPLAEHLTSTTFVDTDVEPETDYCYIIIAHFENGICGEISATVCTRITSDGCAEAPVLTAEALGAYVALEWTGNGALSYSVFRDNEFVGTTDGLSYMDNVPESGNYCYRVESTCEYGMYNSSNEACVSAEVSEEGDAIDEWSADNLTLYPNPTYGQFFIEGQRIAVVQIFNAAGMLVTEIENTEVERITINCDGWNPGIYNVRIISAEGESATRKVTIFR